MLRTVYFVGVAFVLAVVMAATIAVPSAAGPVIGGGPMTPCIVVDIAGTRAGSVDCAAARLGAAARTAQDRAGSTGIAVPDARSPGVVTGVASQTATRQRIGKTFGTGVRPQRPPTPVYTNPIGSRP
ncbi:hypothetical protein KX816_13685 [Sphingosinicellaceae bacterium]|nr:hypothetical protein KX816_13685 [Sphingosinicellaceae bacterium]